MKKANYNSKILGGNTYLIYNFGNNDQLLFYISRNYKEFEELVYNHISLYFNVLAYCTLPKRYCFLVQIPERVTYYVDPDDEEEINVYSVVLTDPVEIGDYFVKQFSRVLISYSQKIKKQEKIKGSLFAKPYKRYLVDTSNLDLFIFYTHYLPERFQESEDFRKYRYSLFRNIDNFGAVSVINKEIVLKYFDGTHIYIAKHEYHHFHRKDYLKLFKSIDGYNEVVIINSKRESEALMAFYLFDF